MPKDSGAEHTSTTNRQRLTSQPRIGVYSGWAAHSSTHPQMNHPNDSLTEDDLLGSFDEETPAANLTWVSLSPPPRSVTGNSRAQQDVPSPRVEKALAVHVTLPPRPDEISPDYEPGPSLPASRKLSHGSSFHGPGSPPIISDVGHDIIFHPASSEYMAAEMNESSPSHRRVSGHGHAAPDTSGLSEGLSSPTQTRLLNTLAVASKWRSAVHPAPSHARHPTGDAPTPTAEPIDINHSTPFATAEQIAGSHIAPSGAPGFADEHEHILNSVPRERESAFSSISLIGRQLGTRQVLSTSLADKLRQHIPPRQRLSSQWTLLFSLDQHGASLSSLYRCVEKYTPSHPTSGNLLVARDSDDTLFGVYVNEAILRREGGFFGSGEALLQNDPLTPRIFPWTGKNLYIALCENTTISFGGGGTSYGLSFDSTFSRNSSSTSPAFDNEVLCATSKQYSNKATRFECIGLEVWGT